MEKNQRYNLVISPAARRMLARHVAFLARVNPEAAQKTRQAFLAAIRSLATMPTRTPFFSGEFVTPNKYHSMFVKNWYLILYQIRDDTVLVDYIVDCRQDYTWLRD